MIHGFAVVMGAGLQGRGRMVGSEVQATTTPCTEHRDLLPISAPWS